MTGADFLITLPEFPDKKVSIKDFGAVENQTDIAGSKRNAAAINSAMSVISNEGGGTVVIPNGIWITGPIRLQSNVCLYLERGAVVKFSKNIAGTLKSLLHITCTITPKHIINTQIKSNVKTIFN